MVKRLITLLGANLPSDECHHMEPVLDEGKGGYLLELIGPFTQILRSTISKEKNHAH